MKRALMIAIYAGSALGLLSVAIPESATAQTADKSKVEVSRKDPYGMYLTDAEGMSLYLFEADSNDASACYDACAEAWPPLIASGEPAGGEQVDTSMLSTIQRKDGANQVTYNGRPLYYFVKDKDPGDTEGQDVEGFGAEWYLVSPKGHKVHEEGEEGPES